MRSISAIFLLAALGQGGTRCFLAPAAELKKPDAAGRPGPHQSPSTPLGAAGPEGKCKGPYRVTPGLSAAAFSGDGRWLATGGGESDKSGTVTLWEVETGKERFALKGHRGLVLALAFSADGKTLASAGWDRTVRLWDVGTGKERATLRGHARQVWSLAFSPDGKLLASGSADRTVKLWDAAGRREKASLRGPPAAAVAFSPDGRTVAVGGDDGTVGLWDVGTGKELTTLRGHTNRVAAAAFAPDGKTLATASWDATVKLWAAPAWRLRATLLGHRGSLVTLAYSPDGKTLASGCHYHRVFREGGPGGEIAKVEDGCEVRLWDPGLGKLRATFEPGAGPGLVAVGFSPDGKALRTVNQDGTVRRWDPTGAGEARRRAAAALLVGQWEVPGKPVPFRLTFSARGDLLVSLRLAEGGWQEFRTAYRILDASTLEVTTARLIFPDRPLTERWDMVITEGRLRVRFHSRWLDLTAAGGRGRGH
jgi:WD40 repeat protein